MCKAMVILFCLVPFSASPAGADLDKQFQSPPDESKVWCYWWWLNGAASKEGITRDFEEMKKQGIAGALLFDAGEAGPEAPRGPAFMSPAWRELYRHAAAEADRLGIVLTVNLCSGWNAGGPWVTNEHAAKKLVAAQAAVDGPGRVNVVLPRPAAVNGFYRDIAVLACPLVGSDGLAKLSASSTFRDYTTALAEDGQDDTRWISNGDKDGMGPTPQKPEHLQFEYAQPQTVAGLYLQPFTDCGPKDVEIQSSDDGKAFRTVKRAVGLDPHKTAVIAFDQPVRARFFRVVFLTSHLHHGQNWNVQVAEIALLGPQELARGGRPAGRGWDSARTQDLARFVDGEGRLAWDAPAGRWKVLRIGCTLHNNPIKCVGSGPAGPEIDTMSREAMDAHFAQTGAKLIADAGALAGRTVQYFHIDSWELGQPTWTPGMREEFRRLRGYDPLAYLPALLNQAVDSPEVTRRFLADYRRTAADLVAAHYYGRLRELTRKAGLRGTHPESGGPFFNHWIDALQCEGINDIPMGEFWKRNIEPVGPISAPPQSNPSVKQAACAAHAYGKGVCQAEAFTSFACDWIDDPWTMKDIGDEAFCHGLTRNVLCFYVHQPRLDAKPGFQWAHVGTHFDRNLTWWDMGGAWLTYLARCQHLLRQGLFVADFAYFSGQDVPGFIAPRDAQPPARPAGFDYDAVNAEVLLTRASAKDGRLTLSDGMSYRYLVLPHRADWTVSPAVLRKIKELTEAGLTVIGPRPAQAQGLGDYPKCDEEVAKLADALWGPGKSATQASTTPATSERKVGQGRVIAGRALSEIVKADGLAADIEFRFPTTQPAAPPAARARLDWIHRRGDGLDIYFVCNLSSSPASAEAVFRVTGRQPELWDAVTGEIRDLPQWRAEGQRTAVALEFAPRQSWFVVFRRKAEPPKAPPGQTAKNFAHLQTVAEPAGPWEVSFDPKWGGPERATFDKLQDWASRPEEPIRYYSGKAVYRKQITLPPVGPGRRVFLDLGTVKNVARVRLNGRDCGVVWTAPWRAEITEAAREGANDLEIEVANLWPNRLIGDAALPKDKRLTVTNVRTYDTMASGTYGCSICEARKKSGKERELFPSGLLGPVRVMGE